VGVSVSTARLVSLMRDWAERAMTGPVITW
jgi:hypothetical protein